LNISTQRFLIPDSLGSAHERKSILEIGV